MQTLHIESEARLREAVAWAAAGSHALEIVAGPTPPTLGRPVQAEHALDVSALTGIVSYQPEELVLTAKAGTPIAEIESALAQCRQFLAFEPPQLRAVDAAGYSGPTLGGIVATGFSGPRRMKAGAVRDHILGIGAVSGRGESFVCGGKVIKNVTGYDLPKVLTGSHGTLAVLHEITLKVLPAPEDQRTLVFLGLDAAAAVRLMTEALQTHAEASATCHLPDDVAVPGKPTEASATALRLEGFAPSVAGRLADLRRRFGHVGPNLVLESELSLAFWRALRDVEPFSQSAAPVWRLSTPPAQGAMVLERLRLALPGARAYLDWGGGLIWLAQPAGTAPEPAAVRGALAESGGHATLIHASARARSSNAVFHPQPAPLAALSKRLKVQFDPARVLNPGRMYEGI
jgi:glycolate oxidase FAD binding subunit